MFQTDNGSYISPPMQKEIHGQIEESVLDAVGWSFFDDLAGDISAPAALPSGGVQAYGMFGAHTAFVPREWELHQARMQRLRDLIAQSRPAQ